MALELKEGSGKGRVYPLFPTGVLESLASDDSEDTDLRLGGVSFGGTGGGGDDILDFRYTNDRTQWTAWRNEFYQQRVCDEVD